MASLKEIKSLAIARIALTGQSQALWNIDDNWHKQALGIFSGKPLLTLVKKGTDKIVILNEQGKQEQIIDLPKKNVPEVEKPKADEGGKKSSKKAKEVSDNKEDSGKAVL